MAINIKRTMSKDDRIADEAIYVDASGNRVKAGHPDAAIKIVGKGGVITPKMAARYNLFPEKKEAGKEASAPKSKK